MSDEQIFAIALNTWGGTRYYAVDIIGKTKTRYRVSLTHLRSPQQIRMPGGRIKVHGDTFLVPKYAVRHISASKLEDDSYDGCVYGLGGTVDAKK